MTHLLFHHDIDSLPETDDDQILVHLYGGIEGRNGIRSIGNTITKAIQRLGVPIPINTIDFLTIALSVTAADTFVQRASSADGWTREFSITLPLCDPAPWIRVKDLLEHTLHFLSGDIWKFEFSEGGFQPPKPFKKNLKNHLIQLKDLDCVCLFSGGLDSAIGAIDLLSEKRAPLLVSHAYKGDKIHQNAIAEKIKSKGHCSQLQINAAPHKNNGETDITMRTRSLNFLAFAAIGACAVKEVSQKEIIELFMPENGFISLNAPLTPRRIGSLSTRTTHPYFIKQIQSIFDTVGIPCKIVNPYQFKTKGEMISQCKDQLLLSDVIEKTVSCSHWKRSNQQCGVCVPCIIRRAALYSADISHDASYTFETLAKVMSDSDRRDDLMALRIAIAKKSKSKIGTWINKSAPLPPEDLENYKKVFTKGLEEVENYLSSEKIS